MSRTAGIALLVDARCPAFVNRGRVNMKDSRSGVIVVASGDVLTSVACPWLPIAAQQTIPFSASVNI